MVFFKRLAAVVSILTVLLVFLTACGEQATPTSIPLNQVTTTTLNNGAPLNTLGSKLIGPTVGANGQITPNAPPADGKTVTGRYFWVGDGSNIWEGGPGYGAPLTKEDLGGQILVQSEDGGLAKDPALSPDGTKLAYSYSPPPAKDPTTGLVVIGADINVIDLNTKKIQTLVKREQPEEYLEFPAWSKDGQTLFFASRSPRRDSTGRVTGTIYTVASYDLKSQQRTDKLASDASQPAPLPDKQSLVFVGIKASDDSYNQSLVLLNLATKQQTILASGTQNFSGFRAPRPSPDGQLIAFGAIGGPDEIPVATPTPNPMTGLGKLWPSLVNSTNLAHAHGLPWDLWLIRPDGSGLHRLTEIFEDEPIAVWTRDQKRIVFLAGNGFYTIGIDGKNLSKRTNIGSHGGFDWWQ